ncbi:MAG TPA: globin domain-containing protein [Haliangiales bacterium]|nr:globin domain-containing protein [Haliangiales bacterium]
MNVALLRDSFELVIERQPQLVTRFYAILFQRYPRARALFGRNAQAAQEKMLADALVAVLDHIEDAAWFRSTLGALGAKHATYGVTEEMYGWVGECLLVALAEAAGEAWSDELHQLWAGAYGAIAGAMLDGARGAVARAA